MTGHHVLDGLQEDLAAQRKFVERRAPVYARLLEILEGPLYDEVAPRLAEAWAARSFGAWYERPLLLLAALRYDVLTEGRAHPLWDAVAARQPSVDSVTVERVTSSLAPGRSRLWRALADRYLQTNETSRGVAWLWPAALAAQVDPDRPLALFDVGASAGLNLVADHLDLIWELGDGEPLPLDPLPHITSRRGFDLRPLDPLDEDQARWLRACIWPGQTGREDRLREAVTAYGRLSRGPSGPVVVRCAAADVPPRLPVVGRGEARALAVQTIVRDYLTPRQWDRYRRGMEEWLRRSQPGGALWVELEVTPRAREGAPPSAIVAHVRTRGGDLRALLLAHCEPHPRILDPDEAAVAELQGLL